MSNIKGANLFNNIHKSPGKKGIFGIAYSILTWGGVAKGVGASFSGIKKVAGKLIEDGHATTFMIDRSTDLFVMTGISDDGWEFYGGDLYSQDWARTTSNANTDVYYVELTQEQVDKYWRLKDELQQQENTTYSELWPNIPGRTRYENCISSSHYISYRMGFGRWASAKGSWIPSVSNWMTWAATSRSTWKHKRFTNCNTHFVEEPGHVYFENA